MNKSLITLGLFLLIWALSMFSVWGQSAPMGCAQTHGTVLPWQDCQGALWLTQAETVIQTSDVVGPGCLADELPDASQTCLLSNERRTVWLMFEVQPLPGGPTTLGAPAGQLRFRIIPGDVDSRQVADDGYSLLGMTDYDFALFDVTGLADRQSACAAIKAATAVGTSGSIQAACNYSGLPGPTGLAITGTGHSIDDQRYDAPIQVTVGQVFLLAVDNYSLNASYFRLRFGGDSASIPAAQVVPTGGQANASPALHTNVACGYGLELVFPQPIDMDSMRTDAFLLTYKGRQLRPITISSQNVDELRGQATHFTLLFSDKLDTGSFQLEQTTRLADRYGREQMIFTRIQTLRPPVRLLSENTRLCGSGSFRAQVSSQPGFGFGGWIVPAGFGTGFGNLGSYSLSASSQPAPGTYTLTYRFIWPEGCPDSVSMQVDILPVPAAPILLPTPNGALQTSLAPSATAEWAGPDSTFAGPSSFTPAQPGVYRVRQVQNGCSSPWSNPVSLGITDIRRSGDIQTSVYPNPAHEVAHIQVSGATGTRLELELISPEGTLVRHQKHTDGVWNRALPLTGLAPGLYTLRITTQTGTTSHRLLLR